jgi:Tfp pilus assembly protein FimT
MTPHIAAQFTVPNLDDSGAEHSELEELAGYLEMLARYARNKAVAQRLRLGAFDPRHLKNTESVMEETYQKLPLCWRW